MTIRTTEDDASPETRFIKHVPAGSVPLPNDKWVRSPKQKDYALCLDPNHEHAGWLLLEGWSDHWVPVRRLTFEELVQLRDPVIGLPGISVPHRKLAGELLHKLQLAAGYDV